MFVCHGNICRSTMAEFVMKDLVRKAGLADKFIINSSATSREEIGCDTHYSTKAKLREMNIPFSKRKAVQITKQDYDMYDYIIVMDNNNLRNLSYIIVMDNNNLRNLSYIIGEDTEHKVYKMMSFVGENRDVKDPWYTDNFDETYADVDKACRALLAKLIKEYNLA